MLLVGTCKSQHNWSFSLENLARSHFWLEPHFLPGIQHPTGRSCNFRSHHLLMRCFFVLASETTFLLYTFDTRPDQGMRRFCRAYNQRGIEIFSELASIRYWLSCWRPALRSNCLEWYQHSRFRVLGLNSSHLHPYMDMLVGMFLGHTLWIFLYRQLLSDTPGIQKHLQTNLPCKTGYRICNRICWCFL